MLTTRQAGERQDTERTPRPGYMDIERYQPGQHQYLPPSHEARTRPRRLMGNSSRRRPARHALRALEDGHLPRHLRHCMGRLDRWLWPLPADEMRPICRPGTRLVRCPLAADVSESFHPVRCRHRDKMLWRGGQLPDYHRGPDA